MTDNNKKKEQLETVIPSDVHMDSDDTPGLLPPQALPAPPPPPTTQDTSTLLSPWWSEEPPIETAVATESEPIPMNTEEEKTIVLTLALAEKAPSTPSIVSISILSFSRSAPKDSQEHWKERCFLMATTEGENREKVEKQSMNQDPQKELETLFDKSKECSMVCFLRSSRKLARERLLEQHDGDESKIPVTFSINPFYGTWVTVAKTPTRCKEHLLNAGDISKKNFKDYYSMELGDAIGHSGEYVHKTFSPLQHLSQRYIDSWKNGDQQAFFKKFWSSVQKGDALHLVHDSTKRLFENTFSHDKKPSDKK